MGEAPAVADELGEPAPRRPRRELDLSGLNPAQYEAVTMPPGPILVVAGAGSGKTRVLTHRLAYLIAELDVLPFEILAITFTNKAAGEMRERVADLVGPVARRMWVSTFHAACSRILRREASLLGYRSSFTIYDQSDAQRLVDWVRRDLNLDPKRFPARTMHASISALKNELVLPPEYAERAVGPAERRLSDVYTEYQRRLQEASALDFDDLLVLAVRLFREQPATLGRWRSILEAIDSAPSAEILELLTSMTSLCDRSEEIYQQHSRSAAARCECCPLFHPLGAKQEAVDCARHNVALLAGMGDLPIVTSAPSCGLMMKREVPELLSDGAAKAVAARVVDIHVLTSSTSTADGGSLSIFFSNSPRNRVTNGSAFSTTTKRLAWKKGTVSSSSKISANDTLSPAYAESRCVCACWSRSSKSGARAPTSSIVTAPWRGPPSERRAARRSSPVRR